MGETGHMARIERKKHAMSASSAQPQALGTDVELEIGGMTCASCANRIERKLNKLEGVSASVNYATEKARISAPAGYDPQDLIAEVKKTGYTAALPAPSKTDPGSPRARGQRPRTPNCAPCGSV